MSESLSHQGTLPLFPSSSALIRRCAHDRAILASHETLPSNSSLLLLSQASTRTDGTIARLVQIQIIGVLRGAPAKTVAISAVPRAFLLALLGWMMGDGWSAENVMVCSVYPPGRSMAGALLAGTVAPRRGPLSGLLLLCCRGGTRQPPPAPAFKLKRVWLERPVRLVFSQLLVWGNSAYQARGGAGARSTSDLSLLPSPSPAIIVFEAE